MKRKVRNTLFLAALLFMSASMLMAQSPAGNNNFWDRTSLSINTNLFFLDGKDFSSGYLIDENGQRFYNNTLLEIGLSHELSENFSLQGEISYTGFNTSNEYGIMFVIPPPEDAITQFRSSLHFVNLAFEPKAQLDFRLNNWTFFWNAGPIISGSFLKTDIDGAPATNTDQYQDIKKSSSSAFGWGVQAATGTQFFFNDLIGLRFEIGYRYLQHGMLYTVDPISDVKRPFDYKTKNFTQRIGLVINL